MSEKLTKQELMIVNSYRRNNGNIDKISEELGIQNNLLLKKLQKRKVKEYLLSGIEDARERLISLSPVILEGLLNIYNDRRISPKVRATIGLGLLDRAGLQQKNNIVINNVNTIISDRAREILANKLTIDAEATEITGKSGD